MGKAEKIAAIVMVLEESTERQVDEVYDFIMDELDLKEVIQCLIYGKGVTGCLK